MILKDEYIVYVVVYFFSLVQIFFNELIFLNQLLIFFQLKPIFFFKKSISLIFVSAVSKTAWFMFWGCNRKLGNYFHSLYSTHSPTYPPSNFIYFPYLKLQTATPPQILFSFSFFFGIWFAPRNELLTSRSVWICSWTISSPLDHASNCCQHANFSRYH